VVYGVDGDRGAVFTTIYRENAWGSQESRSGGGSTLSATRLIRKRLPALLAAVGAKTFLDAPCGDYNWMKTVDLGAVSYIGADIVPELIADLQARHSDATHGFQMLDIVVDAAPEVDVWMCREALMHIPSADVMEMLRNFLRSNSRFLLATSFDLTADNEDIPMAGFRPLNLERPPIGLPKPLRRFDDFVAPMQPRIMGLWSRDQVARALERAR
jgi:hypothetical protein